MEGSPLRVALVDKTVREEWPEGCRRAFYFYHVGDTVELGVSYEPGAEVSIDFCGRQDRAVVPEKGVLKKEYVLDREGQCRIRVVAGGRAWEKTIYVYPEGRAREPVEVTACSAVYADNHLTVMGVLQSRAGGYYPVRLVAYRDGNMIADVMAGVVEPGSTSFETTMPWYAEVPDTVHVTVVPELDCLDGWETNRYTCTTRVVLPSAGQPARGPVAGAALVRSGRIASGRILGFGGFRVEPVGVEPAITGYRDEARLRVSVSRSRPGQVMVMRGTRVAARLNVSGSETLNLVFTRPGNYVVLFRAPGEVPPLRILVVRVWGVWLHMQPPWRIVVGGVEYTGNNAQPVQMLVPVVLGYRVSVGVSTEKGEWRAVSGRHRAAGSVRGEATLVFTATGVGQEGAPSREVAEGEAEVRIA